MCHGQQCSIPSHLGPVSHASSTTFPSRTSKLVTSHTPSFTPQHCYSITSFISLVKFSQMCSSIPSAGLNLHTRSYQRLGTILPLRKTYISMSSIILLNLRSGCNMYCERDSSLPSQPFRQTCTLASSSICKRMSMSLFRTGRTYCRDVSVRKA